MNKKFSKKKIIIPVCCVVIIAAIVCGVIFFPHSAEYKVEKFSYVNKTQSAVEYNESFKKIFESENSFLAFENSTGAVALGIKNQVFNGFSSDAAQDKYAELFSIALRDEAGNQYFMNSADNSVDLGSFSIFRENNILRLDFNLYSNKKESEKGEKANVWVKLPVEISVENGGFKVSSDLGAASCAEGFVIEKISFLPGLFSVSIPSENMKYYLPEGSGAAVSLDMVTQEDFSKTLSVYGSDVAFRGYSPDAVLPCFAFSNGKALASVVIDEGDALSQISVKRDKIGRSSLFNTFIVTPFSVSRGRLVSGESYNGTVSQVYFLTDGSSADYNQLADVTRDYLIDKEYIPAQISDKFPDLPFFITVIGSADGKKATKYTDFENASEIVALLKSRGVRSVALRFAGGGDSGLKTTLREADEISELLGGEASFDELCRVSAANNSTVWYDFNLATEPLKKDDSKVLVNEKLLSYVGAEPVNARLASNSFVSSAISSSYKLMSELDSANACVNDLSRFLYTDLVDGIDRQSALEGLRSKTEVLSLGGLMLESPAVYLMNNADAVFSMPEKTSLEAVEGVTSVPLLQMVLHGSIAFGTEPVNLSADSNKAILRAVEYGACPSFVFTYNNAEALDYGLYAAQTAKYYSKVKQIMPLMDMEITSHEKVVSGVYKVTYDYSKIVYVNYNPSVVEVNGIMISAQDFVII